MTSADQPLPLRSSSAADAADRAALLRIADGELAALEDLYAPATLGIAAVLVIAVLGGWNLLLQNDLSAARSYERSVAAVLDTAAQPGSLTAILAGDGGVGAGLAAVDSSGNAALAIRNLAPTSGASVYEAWVIAGDGVPVPLGGFKVGQDGTASFHAGGLPTASGIVLALTLEPGPGATTPTLPIITKGVAGPAAR